LYNPVFLFTLKFVISFHVHLATLASAKMWAVWWGKSSEKTWQKKTNSKVMKVDESCNSASAYLADFRGQEGL
jgi:hypothetical protein